MQFRMHVIGSGKPLLAISMAKLFTKESGGNILNMCHSGSSRSDPVDPVDPVARIGQL